MKLFCELMGLSPCLHCTHKAKDLRRVEKPYASNDKKFAGLSTFICVNCEQKVSRTLLSRLFTFLFGKFPPMLSNLWACKKEAISILDLRASACKRGQPRKLIKVLLAYVFSI